ncbi:LemA family protein [Kosmotoga sp. DU53]|uniref:LemA family protein n=1 Tax=Kosmotoga sp. DU53 TaxID=1310160 RepID=UPI0007C54E79|nr:LemA family protein [Kosmotoga sp. DU53]OAA23407.1 membrane protein [Kosmotoga sp. DU53]
MLFVLLIGFVVMLLCVLFAMQNLKKKRLIDDTPTSKVKGVFIGLVELKGKVKTTRPLTSYLTERPCVYYRWSIEEHWTKRTTETYTDSHGKTRTRTKTESGWKTVASGGDEIPFELCDDTGCILIKPEKARVEAITVMNRVCGRNDPLYYGKGPDRAIMYSDHRRRFVERIIPPDADLYVFGQAREREDIVAPEVAYDKEAPMFLISIREEKKLSRRYSLYYWLLVAVGIIAAIATAYFSIDRTFSLPQEPIQPYIVTIGSFLVMLFIGWFWVTYNSLKSLQRRVQQGWSQIEVQLKRRHDLIPLLVNVVKGLVKHEQDTQEKLAELRGELENMSGKEVLKVLIERYPNLKSQEAFVKLQKELSDTEDRIALARGYYNEIASFYNARLERFPDLIVAKLGRLKHQRLWKE